MQKSHPFGLAENRFTWVKIYCNGNDLKNHKKLFKIRKDESRKRKRNGKKFIKRKS